MALTGKEVLAYRILVKQAFTYRLMILAILVKADNK